MIVLAIVPAVWRRVMDRRVLAHFGGDVTLANLSPGKRDRLLATYPPPADPPQRHTDGAVDGSERMTSRDAAGDEALTWRCPGCGYTYDVVAGEEREGFAAGTAWPEIPEAWCCPRLRGARQGRLRRGGPSGGVLSGNRGGTAAAGRVTDLFPSSEPAVLHLTLPSLAW